MHQITLNWICFKGMNIFVFYCWYALGKKSLMESFIFCAVTAFIQKFSGYFILKIEARKNLKSLLVHFEKNLLQDQEKTTKFNKNQIKPKQN